MGSLPDQPRFGLPLVTVIVPCRNEESSIEAALLAVTEQDYPVTHIEVVVVDGGSVDETAMKAKQALAGHDFARADVIDNEQGTTPSNLNAGLTWALGEVIVRVDARSRLPQHYVSAVVDRLTSDDSIAVVGGSQVACAPQQTLEGFAIARALNNRYGMGLARYRRNGAASGRVDTVYLGVFRRDQLAAVGGWNEEFTTNQDFELNQRMQQVGSVWFEEGLPVGYVPRSSIGALWKQYRRFGRAKVSYWKRTGESPTRRQMVLLIGPPVLGGLAIGIIARVSLLGRIATLAAAVVAMFAIDDLGASEQPGSLAERALAGSVNAVVGAGWWSGVVEGFVVGHRESGPTR